MVKAALFDHDGRQVAAALTPVATHSPHPGWHETGMEAAWLRVVASVREVLAIAGPAASRRIAAVGVTGCMVGAWLIDAHGAPVRDAILWNDARAQALIDRATAADPGFMATIFRSSGSVMQQGCTLPVLRWLAEHEPAAIARTRWVLGCKDWIRFRLTGAIDADETEASVAPGSAVGRGRSAPMLHHLGVAQLADRLPAPRRSTALAGEVTPSAAGQTGLREGTPVAIGAGDVPASAIGAGAVSPGMACTVLGTTCLNCVVLAEPEFTPPDTGLLFCLPDSLWLRAMVNVAGTSNLDWVLARLLPNAAETRFADAEAMAAGVAPGADGVIYLPYLSSVGVIAPFVEPAARGEFFGLSDRHDTAHLLRAVYEGLAYAIRDCYAALPCRPREIRLSGGGGRSRFLCQLIADICDVHVVVPEGAEFGAKGAALLAGVAVGWYPGVAATAARTRPAQGFAPAPSRHYESTFATYAALRRALLPVWQQAARQQGPA